MARTVTGTAIRRIMARGLSGWEAGKLILQDLVDLFIGGQSTLTDDDRATIRQAPTGRANIHDYNLFVALCRSFRVGRMVAESTCKSACLEITQLDRVLENAVTRHDVERSELFAPHVVTRKQYNDMVADERFLYVYAVVENCPEVWLDEKGYYRGPTKPSRWITGDTEVLLGLINHNEEPVRSVVSVGAELRNRLDSTIENVRVFLAIKAVLDAAADAVGLDVPGKGGILANSNRRLDIHVALYNLRLEELEEQRVRDSSETRLDKALQVLSAIDVDRLRPNPDSMKQLKANILTNARDTEWLRIKIGSLDCADGYSFRDLMN